MDRVQESRRRSKLFYEHTISFGYLDEGTDSLENATTPDATREPTVAPGSAAASG